MPNLVNIYHCKQNLWPKNCCYSLETGSRRKAVVKQTCSLSAGFAAFTVARSADIDVPQGVRIAFDTVITNINNAFYPPNNDCICQTGVYMFSFSILSRIANGLWLNLMVEGEVVARSLGWSSSVLDTATNIVIIECFDGQNVWLESNSDMIYILTDFILTPT